MSETSKEGFVPRHLRGVDLESRARALGCQWHQIASSRLRNVYLDDHGFFRPKICTQPVWEQTGLRLCQEHTDRIGHLNPRLYTLRNAKKRLAWEEDGDKYLLRNENARLRRQLQWQAKRLRGETEATAEKPTEGQIYFLRVGGYIKIGWTSDLAKRMRNGYHPDSQLLAVKPGTRKDERAIHRKHAHLCTHGREWFPMAPQIMEEVQAAIAAYGEPPAVLFSAQAKQVRQLGPAPNTRAI